MKRLLITSGIMALLLSAQLPAQAKPLNTEQKGHTMTTRNELKKIPAEISAALANPNDWKLDVYLVSENADTFMPVTIWELKEKGPYVFYHQFTDAQNVSLYIQALNSLEIQDYSQDIKDNARALFEFTHKNRNEKIMIASERGVKHFMIFQIRHVIGNNAPKKYPVSITFNTEKLVELTKDLYKK